MSITLIVKWNKETITLSSFDPVIGVKGLKQELEEKTGVPSDRMKIMAKSKGLWKGVLKDDADFAAIDWANACDKDKTVQLLLMGSATKLAAPTTKTVFLEDMPPEEIAKVVEPAGM
jgi:ubiquitin carboxyl-terminal hydrolase 14